MLNLIFVLSTGVSSTIYICLQFVKDINHYWLINKKIPYRIFISYGVVFVGCIYAFDVLLDLAYDCDHTLKHKRLYIV